MARETRTQVGIWLGRAEARRLEDLADAEGKSSMQYVMRLIKPMVAPQNIGLRWAVVALTNVAIEKAVRIEGQELHTRRLVW